MSSENVPNTCYSVVRSERHEDLTLEEPEVTIEEPDFPFEEPSLLAAGVVSLVVEGSSVLTSVGSL